MTEIDLEITEVEAALRHLKKIRSSQRKSAAIKAARADPAVRAKMSAARKAAWADPAVRAKMSAARKAAWAEKHEADMRLRQKHEKRAADALREVPHDALEVALFGGRR